MRGAGDRAVPERGVAPEGALSVARVALGLQQPARAVLVARRSPGAREAQVVRVRVAPEARVVRARVAPGVRVARVLRVPVETGGREARVVRARVAPGVP